MSYTYLVKLSKWDKPNQQKNKASDISCSKNKLCCIHPMQIYTIFSERGDAQWSSNA